MTDDLDWVKRQQWFYEFSLPDGSKTASYLPEIARKIHGTREKALRFFLQRTHGTRSSAIDVSCHEGYYSLVLAEYFESVVGIDKNQDSLDKAERISRLLCPKPIGWVNGSIEDWHGDEADLVLCFGLLYHTENTIQVLRKITSLAREAICIETQVLPFDISARIEDGSCMWQRDLNGLFGLCRDYSHSKEGGLTDLALIPSRGGLLFLLDQFGFGKVEVYQAGQDDYEQFFRASRLILFAERSR